ncbi:hypothetical protein [Photorhabdus luminescens]|uniref:hypothetical protein n=1 Tax=Photorhabdus luminescens TaxID=29488 RepID=UPI0022402317|nr:hypothetical protein [Photorhabdus luminescens]MCW7763470.1 hypothetical protein [Photorhabdus luminescens subsp. venezuelensis]
MARHMWPDFQEQYSEWSWYFAQGSIDMTEIRLLGEGEEAVIQTLSFMDKWTARDTKQGIVLHETVNGVP